MICAIRFFQWRINGANGLRHYKLRLRKNQWRFFAPLDFSNGGAMAQWRKKRCQ
jgi:hypothetical protein